MGLFSRKKKTTSITLPSSPNSFTTVSPSPPLSPVIQLSPPEFKPQLHLRVAVDPVPSRLTDEEGLFQISVDYDADMAVIKSAITEQIGQVGINLFKVSIPILAYRQAQEYLVKFSSPVNLLTTFPTFNLDDPSQYTASLGPTGWTGTPKDTSSLKASDWFADSTPSDTISILVRTSHASPSASRPYTLLTHFAPSELSTLCRAGPSRQSRRSPTVVCISPDSSVRDVKAEIVRAGGKEVSHEHLDKIVLWKVEMSEEEMIVIGERGGLKGGRMPWPYPPGGLVPVPLSDSSLPINHYFPDHQSNSRIISLSVWLPPSLTTSSDMSRSESSTIVPPFKFPMDFSEPAAPAPRRVRARPSTAPAVVIQSTNTSPSTSAESTFGEGQSASKPGPRPLGRLEVSFPDLYSRPRVASPLSSSTILPNHGLGINVPKSPTSPSSPCIAAGADARGSVSISDCSSDEGIPSLSFSQISLSTEPADIEMLHGLKTPDATPSEEKDDWLSPHANAEHRDLRKGHSMRIMTLGSWKHRRGASDLRVVGL